MQVPTANYTQTLADFLRFTGQQPRRVRYTIKSAVENANRDIQTDAVFFLILGMTGSGKSTFIQHCTGKTIQVGHGLQSCTTYISIFASLPLKSGEVQVSFLYIHSFTKNIMFI
jgi:energy-coupling factor transporter ATP-binding protein EcfA2